MSCLGSLTENERLDSFFPLPRLRGWYVHELGVFLAPATMDYEDQRVSDRPHKLTQVIEHRPQLHAQGGTC